MHDPSLWTAATFLRATAEFVRMTPDRNAWSEEALQDNPPRQVRLRRLHALARAFDIQPGFAALLDGSFIHARPDEVYAALDASVTDQIRRRQPTYFQAIDADRHPRGSLVRAQGEEAYEFLVTYLLEAYKLMSWNEGVLEASGVFLHAVGLVGQARDPVAQAIRPIEDLVARVIAPDGRAFGVEELSQHGWPPEDLQEIDIDFF